MDDWMHNNVQHTKKNLRKHGLDKDDYDYLKIIIH